MADPYQVATFDAVTTTIAAAAATTVLTSDKFLGEVGHLCLEVENTGANAVTTAILQVRATRDGTFQTLISNWTVVTLLMKWSSSDIASLASSSKATCYLEIPPCAEWKLVLTSTSGTDITARGIGR